MTFLLIDDDPDFLILTKQGLIDIGYTVDTAQNLEEAKIKISEKTYDVITLDLNLNHVPGINFISTVKTHSPESFLLIVTGFASISTTVDVIKRGANDIISKPITISILLDKISRSANTKLQPTQNLHTHEWELIQETLKNTNFNISQTAKLLGITRRTLQRKLKKPPVPPQKTN